MTVISCKKWPIRGNAQKPNFCTKCIDARTKEVERPKDKPEKKSKGVCSGQDPWGRDSKLLLPTNKTVPLVAASSLEVTSQKPLQPSSGK